MRRERPKSFIGRLFGKVGGMLQGHSSPSTPQSEDGPAQSQPAIRKEDARQRWARTPSPIPTYDSSEEETADEVARAMPSVPGPPIVGSRRASAPSVFGGRSSPPIRRASETRISEETRVRIMNQVKNGELTLDEALELVAAAEADAATASQEARRASEMRSTDAERITLMEQVRAGTLSIAEATALFDQIEAGAAPGAAASSADPKRGTATRPTPSDRPLPSPPASPGEVVMVNFTGDDQVKPVSGVASPGAPPPRYVSLAEIFGRKRTRSSTALGEADGGAATRDSQPGMTAWPAATDPTTADATPPPLPPRKYRSVRHCSADGVPAEPSSEPDPMAGHDPKPPREKPRKVPPPVARKPAQKPNGTKANAVTVGVDTVALHLVADAETSA